MASYSLPLKPLAFALAALPIAFGFTSCKNTTIELQEIGRYQSGVFAQSAAEIVTYDAVSQRAFVVNANASTVDVLGMSDPTAPVLIGTIDATALGGGANSVSAHNGIVAVAIQAENKQNNGVVAFYNASDLSLLNSVTVGALPDMVTFSPDGKYVLVANEGEPSSDYKNDPEGSISVINLRRGVSKATVKTADFSAYIGKEDELRAQGIRIFGPGANAAQDLEPEYISVSDDGKTAYVSLQENNAIAVVDVRRAKVKTLLPLGTKDHSLLVNGMDASNKDDAINIAPWPVLGMYQPDSIDTVSIKGKTYIVTANEGDARDYWFDAEDEASCLAAGGQDYDEDDGCLAFSEELRVKDLELDPAVFSDPDLVESENLGRLKTTSTLGDANNDGLNEAIYSYGARSFTIWDTEGKVVFDSGNDFEVITSAQLGDNFNNDNEENDGDGRSDDKGPEPEAIVVGKVLGKTYAFIGLERVGGIMVYDISVPADAQFLQYITNRNFDVEPGEGVDAGDLGPEGFSFVPAEQSPNGMPLLLVGNEVSGTTTVYQVTPRLVH
ncbi:choice-of-anchor I family protein [Oceanicoccus sp. KOV_DT_Chl]|uniref:choice-of-anchor I family protein n=1 Tax=Oceanicoccus sp. KOV_DT_Chl TaxID=1904639 RepID=UPI000C7C9024|nr:choice-of-anchor I family protein [Oceanicoccus sp. KOV_DT_Chl]